MIVTVYSMVKGVKIFVHCPRLMTTGCWFSGGGFDAGWMPIVWPAFYLKPADNWRETAAGPGGTLSPSSYGRLYFCLNWSAIRARPWDECWTPLCHCVMNSASPGPGLILTVLTRFPKLKRLSWNLYVYDFRGIVPVCCLHPQQIRK